jgi:hypothetical protein
MRATFWSRWCAVMLIVVAQRPTGACAERARTDARPLSVRVCTPAFASAIASQIDLELAGWPEGARVEVEQACDSLQRARVHVTVGRRGESVDIELWSLEEHLGARAIAFLVREEIEALSERPDEDTLNSGSARLVQALSYLDPELAPRTPPPSPWSRHLLSLGPTLALHPLAPTFDLGLHIRGRFDWFEIGAVATSAVVVVDSGSAQTASALATVAVVGRVELAPLAVLLGVRAEAGFVWASSGGALRGGALVGSIGAEATASLLVPVDETAAVEFGLAMGYRSGAVLVLDGVAVLRVDGLRAVFTVSVVLSP